MTEAFIGADYLVGPEKVRPGLFQGVASIRRTKSVVFVCSFSARAELRSRHCVHALQVGRCNFHAGNSMRCIDISDDRSLYQGRLLKLGSEIRANRFQTESLTKTISCRIHVVENESSF